MKSIKALALGGGASLGAGIFAFEAFKKPLEEATKFQTEVARFQGLGLGDKATTDAVKFAKGMDIMGASARDNMRIIRDATTIMGSLEHGQAIAPLLARMRFGIESVMGDGKGSGFETALQASLKVGELRGALMNKATGQIDPARFGNTLNLMTQAYVASGGLVKPTDYLAALKTGGVSAKLMNDEMFFFGLGHFMQESGGSRTGTAAMSMFQNWEMGRMPQRVAERMAALGLLKKSAIHYGTTGHITGVDPAGIVGAEAFAANPFQWVNQQAVPALQKRGYTGNMLNLQLASLLGIRTASNLADQFLREKGVADLYVERAKKAVNVDGLYNIASGTMAGKENDLTAKYASLMLELGEVALPGAIRGTQILINGIKTMTAFTKDNPGLMKLIIGAGAGTAALATLGGTALLLTAGFRSLNLALSFTGLGGIVGIGKLAGGLGLVGVALKGLAGAVLAWEAGKLVGGAIYDKTLAGTSMGDDLGRGIAHTLAFFGNDEAKQSVGQMGRYSDSLRSASGKVIRVESTLNVDGRKMAQVVSDHVGRASQVSTGTTQFDSNYGLAPLFLPATK